MNGTWVEVSDTQIVATFSFACRSVILGYTFGKETRRESC